MHSSCVDKQCNACLPGVENRVVSWVLWLFMGATGTPYLLSRQYYLAILNAMCPGYFFVYRLSFIVGAGNYLNKDRSDEFIFVFACSQVYGGWFSIISMWITGFYYVDLHIGTWKTYIEPVVSMVSMSVAIGGLHYNRQMGMIVTTGFTMYHIWKWPSLWDLHFGNCFGILTIGMYVVVCLVIIGAIDRMFESLIPMQIYVISHVFYRQRSMKHYFSANQAYIIVFVSLQMFVSILMRKIDLLDNIRHQSHKLSK
jgi:hypothetical protein